MEQRTLSTVVNKIIASTCFLYSPLSIYLAFSSNVIETNCNVCVLGLPNVIPPPHQPPLNLPSSLSLPLSSVSTLITRYKINTADCIG